MSYNESLKSDSNYPPMTQSQWDSAPWNYDAPDPRKFYVCASQTLSKSTTVTTDDYVIEEAYLDKDEGGGYAEEILTYTTDWNKAYNDEHYTPLELIQKFKELLEEPDVKSILGKEADYLIKECSNWIEDEFEVVEE